MSDKPKIPFHPVFNPSIRASLDAVKEAIAKDEALREKTYDPKEIEFVVAGTKFKSYECTFENCTFTRMSDEEFENCADAPTLWQEARRARASEAEKARAISSLMLVNVAALDLLENIADDCPLGVHGEDLHNLLKQAGRR